MDQLIEWIVLYGVFLFSVTCHEAGHAWAALRGGDVTAYLGGQVTLDPRPHIQREPIGTVVVPLIGLAMSGFPIGWASAPYNAGWAFAFPKRAAWMAFAAWERFFAFDEHPANNRQKSSGKRCLELQVLELKYICFLVLFIKLY